MAFPFRSFDFGRREIGLRAGLRELPQGHVKNRWRKRRSGGSGGGAGGPEKTGPRIHFESLEPRYLLSADLMPFAVDMLDPSIGNELTLKLDGATNTLQVIDARDPAAPAVVASQALGVTSEVVVTGTDQDDRLTLDLSDPFKLPGGISFTGNLGLDSLVIQGGAFDSVEHDATGDGSGLIRQSDLAGETSISYGGLESVRDDSLAALRGFANKTGLGRELALGDDGAAGDGRMRVGGAGLAEVTFAGPASALTIRAGDLGDLISLGAMDSVFGASLSVLGGLGADSLAADGSNAWRVTGGDSGDLTGAASASFTDIESLVGGSGSDSFALVGGTLSGGVEGGGGDDSLAGDDGPNDWTVSGTDAGTVTGLGAGFTGIESLIGGLGSDSFRLDDASVISGTIAGGGGRDALDYSAATGGVSVDLAAGTATRTGGISEIEDATGGAGADSLSGDAGDNILTGGAGDDVFRGGGGSENRLRFTELGIGLFEPHEEAG